MKLRFLEKYAAPQSEYRANLAALNIFFGAVLGFVIAGLDQFGSIQFAWVLFCVSVVVICIQCISASKQRQMYAALSIFLILALPSFAAPVLGPGEALPDKLQPTLGVWAILVMFTELFFPRLEGQPETTDPEAPGAQGDDRLLR